jgi:hypothetical protein
LFKHRNLTGANVKKTRLTLLTFFLMAAFVISSPVDNTPSSSRKIRPLTVGDVLPTYTLTDTEYQQVSLYQYLEEQPIVLIYYRGGW